jgi:hypothetical protein
LVILANCTKIEPTPPAAPITKIDLLVSSWAAVYQTKAPKPLVNGKAAASA